jgi:hypothetical protein
MNMVGSSVYLRRRRADARLAAVQHCGVYARQPGVRKEIVQRNIQGILPDSVSFRVTALHGSTPSWS